MITQGFRETMQKNEYQNDQKMSECFGKTTELHDASPDKKRREKEERNQQGELLALNKQERQQIKTSIKDLAESQYNLNINQHKISKNRRGEEEDKLRRSVNTELKANPALKCIWERIYDLKDNPEFLKQIGGFIENVNSERAGYLEESSKQSSSHKVGDDSMTRGIWQENQLLAGSKISGDVGQSQFDKKFGDQTVSNERGRSGYSNHNVQKHQKIKEEKIVEDYSNSVGYNNNDSVHGTFAKKEKSVPTIPGFPKISQDNLQLPQVSSPNIKTKEESAPLSYLEQYKLMKKTNDEYIGYSDGSNLEMEKKENPSIYMPSGINNDSIHMPLNKSNNNLNLGFDMDPKPSRLENTSDVYKNKSPQKNLNQHAESPQKNIKAEMTLDNIPDPIRESRQVMESRDVSSRFGRKPNIDKEKINEETKNYGKPSNKIEDKKQPTRSPNPDKNLYKKEEPVGSENWLLSDNKFSVQLKIYNTNEEGSEIEINQIKLYDKNLNVISLKAEQIKWSGKNEHVDNHKIENILSNRNLDSQESNMKYPEWLIEFPFLCDFFELELQNLTAEPIGLRLYTGLNKKRCGINYIEIMIDKLKVQHSELKNHPPNPNEIYYNLVFQKKYTQPKESSTNTQTSSSNIRNNISPSDHKKPPPSHSNKNINQQFYLDDDRDIVSISGSFQGDNNLLDGYIFGNSTQKKPEYKNTGKTNHDTRSDLVRDLTKELIDDDNGYKAQASRKIGSGKGGDRYPKSRQKSRDNAKKGGNVSMKFVPYQMDNDMMTVSVKDDESTTGIDTDNSSKPGTRQRSRRGDRILTNTDNKQIQNPQQKDLVDDILGNFETPQKNINWGIGDVMATEIAGKARKSKQEEERDKIKREKERQRHMAGNDIVQENFDFLEKSNSDLHNQQFFNRTNLSRIRGGPNDVDDIFNIEGVISNEPKNVPIESDSTQVTSQQSRIMNFKKKNTRRDN